jgi:capsular exopolysaccharide synthesis family protein
MSRLFEALQRSESEQAGAGSIPLSSSAAELLQAAERDAEYSAAETGFDQCGTDQFGGDQFRTLSAFPPPDSKLICLTAPDSLAAEKFRFLGVRLRQMQQKRALKKVLVTSTLPEEGKSMVAANLATTLAKKESQKILLLEGDLRRPTLPEQLGIGHNPGLSEWLQGDFGPITNIYRLAAGGFWFLPAGTPPENPLELMQSGKLSALIEHLDSWFDWIIIDSPPVLPLADTSVWARLADGILLVAREGTTEKQPLKRGLQALEGSKMLGAVLNSATDTHHSDYYQRYRYAPASAKEKTDKDKTEKESIEKEAQR